MHNAHSYWLHYFALFGLVVMSLLWIDTQRQEPVSVVKQCAIDVMHSGTRVTYVGEGRVWE